VTVAARLAAGARALRAHPRLVLALYLVELGTSLLFAAAAGAVFVDRYGHRPLFARGVAGDDPALALALLHERGALSTLVWLGLAWALGWALVSLYLGAGLLGAFAGRGFGATAGARVGAFARLWLATLVPWAVVLLVAGLGLVAVGLELDDTLALGRMIGRAVLGLAPALALAGIVGCAVDHARADLVVRGGGAVRALLRHLVRAVARPAALGHYLCYAGAWLAITMLYVAGTIGAPLGALALLALRQLVCALRFGLRCATSGGQLAALQLEVLEVGQVLEGAEAGRDLGGAEGPEAVE
jgi:hypothetical protein